MPEKSWLGDNRNDTRNNSRLKRSGSGDIRLRALHSRGSSGDANKFQEWKSADPQPLSGRRLSGPSPPLDKT
ncbi:hypothetical protein DIPPA_16623 [Diplonema papillatum]|nr:hypothetical protein DIPPA_16623 [Diplonema papillatum]